MPGTMHLLLFPSIEKLKEIEDISNYPKVSHLLHNVIDIGWCSSYYNLYNLCGAKLATVVPACN